MHGAALLLLTRYVEQKKPTIQQDRTKKKATKEVRAACACCLPRSLANRGPGLAHHDHHSPQLAQLMKDISSMDITFAFHSLISLASTVQMEQGNKKQVVQNMSAILVSTTWLNECKEWPGWARADMAN